MIKNLFIAVSIFLIGLSTGIVIVLFNKIHFRQEIDVISLLSLFANIILVVWVSIFFNSKTQKIKYEKEIIIDCAKNVIQSFRRGYYQLEEILSNIISYSGISDVFEYEQERKSKEDVNRKIAMFSQAMIEKNDELEFILTLINLSTFNKTIKSKLTSIVNKVQNEYNSILKNYTGDMAQKDPNKLYDVFLKANILIMDEMAKFILIVNSI